jgi:hypothetical protein
LALVKKAANDIEREIIIKKRARNYLQVKEASENRA